MPYDDIPEEYRESVERARKMWWVNTRTGVRTTQSPYYDSTVYEGVNTYVDDKGDLWTRGA